MSCFQHNIAYALITENKGLYEIRILLLCMYDFRVFEEGILTWKYVTHPQNIKKKTDFIR